MNSSAIFVFLFLILTDLVADGRKQRQCKKQMHSQQQEFAVGAHLINSSVVPYQCLMRTKIRMGIQCSCSILSAWFVLTSAYCIGGVTSVLQAAEIYDEFEGEIYTGVEDTTELSDVYRIRDFEVHKENGEAELSKVDIAVIMVDRPIRFKTYVQWIPLVDNNDYQKPGRNVYISGYGVSDNSFQTIDNKLYGLWMTTVSCEGFAKYPEQKVCAQKKDPSIMKYCTGSGQSGGPLVDIKTYQLVGLLFKSFCANDSQLHKYPDQFANVYWFREWIEEVKTLLLRKWGVALK